MKQFYILLFSFLVFSCGNKKVVELPEISHSDITEIPDVSAAYLFYNETQADSVELNRKNLISTTNWLVNVDKRLTLKQVIPHIKFLQDKKANAGHKNEKAKNYFTCHDTSRNNLGFVEFTDIEFIEEHSWKYLKKVSNISLNRTLNIEISNLDNIVLAPFIHDSIIKVTSFSKLNNVIEEISNVDNNTISLVLEYNGELTFQDYISLKSKISNLNIKNVSISKEEFIY